MDTELLKPNGYIMLNVIHKGPSYAAKPEKWGEGSIKKLGYITAKPSAKCKGPRPDEYYWSSQSKTIGQYANGTFKQHTFKPH